MKWLLLVLGFLLLLVGISMLFFDLWIPGLILAGLGVFAILVPLATGGAARPESR